jgi:hypothetical protein
MGETGQQAVRKREAAGRWRGRTRSKENSMAARRGRRPGRDVDSRAGRRSRPPEREAVRQQKGGRSTQVIIGVVVLAVVGFVVSLMMGDGPGPGRKRGTSAGRKPAVATLRAPRGPITVNGDGGDWSGIEPLWQEAGGTGRGQFGDGIDVKQVRFSKDDEKLYVFLHCSPSVAERFAAKATSDELCDIYIDTDGDPSTGCMDVLGFEYGTISGYELKLWVPLGVRKATGEPESPFVACTIVKAQAGEFELGGKDYDSANDPSVISHGADGVELALPLEELGLTSGRLRVLISESTHTFDKIGYSEGILNTE